MKNFLLVIFILAGCTLHVSKNQQRNGPFFFQGGVINGKQTSENLEFSRNSLYQELNLLMEILVIRMDKMGVFKAWLTQDELEVVTRCKYPLYFLVYTFDENRIRQGMLNTQMQELGFKQIAVPHFRENLVMHPGFIENTLRLYKHYAFCGSSEQKNPIVFNFPGFDSVKIAL